jgi:hypothetical protein
MTKPEWLYSTADETPNLVFYQILLACVRLHGLVKNASPLILKILTADSAPPCSTTPDSWLKNDDVVHGNLAVEGRDLKMVYPDHLGRLRVMDAFCMTDLHAADPVRLAATEWARLDLGSFIYKGSPIVTLMAEPRGGDNANRVQMVEEVLQPLKHKFHSPKSGRLVLPSYILQPELRSALKHFPAPVAKAFDSLGGELAGVCHWLGSNINGTSEYSSVITPLAARLTDACIRVLIATTRALAFHGFGWPRLEPENAKQLLSEIWSRGWMSKADVSRSQRRLKASDRDVVLNYLAHRGVVEVDGDIISAVAPERFLQGNFSLQSRAAMTTAQR